MPAESVNTGDLINTLISFNKTVLTQEIALTAKLESDLVALPDPSRLQGEVEEILRQVLEVTQKTIEAVLAMQQTLQERIVESYFPAQD